LFEILGPVDRDQDNPKIADFLEQAMQGSLIGHRTDDQACAILFQIDRQALEPLCPLVAQMALNPDLIDQGLVQAGFFIGGVSHYPIPLPSLLACLFLSEKYFIVVCVAASTPHTPQKLFPDKSIRNIPASRYCRIEPKVLI
jgi:hypothetical protein